MNEDPDKKYRRSTLTHLWPQYQLKDLIKIILTVTFLVSSIAMYRYEPPPRSINIPPESVRNTSDTHDPPTVHENPYGFHPFYQVHGRVQYKNPAIDLCHGIDPQKTILLTILSRASNVHIREAIRQTWGAVRLYNDIEIRLVFIVGVDDGMIRQIEIEQSIYHGVYRPSGRSFFFSIH